MQTLLPGRPPRPVPDLREAYAGLPAGAPAPHERPWVVVGMIASADGATAVEGRSRGLGGPGDTQVFRALRARADAILVGAGTVRDERYGPPRPGQGRLAIVSATGSLDWAHLAPHRPWLVTTEEAGAAAAHLSADVITAGRGTVDLALALRTLYVQHGVRTVVSEGGPSVNGQLVAAGLVDEVCITVAPWLVSGPSARLAHGPAAPAPTRLRLHHVLEDDGWLFLRYVVAR